MSGRSIACFFPVATLSLVSLMDYFSRNLIFPLGDSIRHDVPMSTFEADLTQGMAYAIPLALLSIPAGYVTDRFHRPLLLTVCIGLLTAGNLMTGLAGTFTFLLFGRLLIGVSITGLTCILVPYISEVVSPRWSALAIGVSFAMANVGSYISIGCSTVIADWLQHTLVAHHLLLSDTPAWRLYIVALSLMTGFLVVPAILLPEPRRTSTPSERRHLDDRRTALLLLAVSELKAVRREFTPFFIAVIFLLVVDNGVFIWSIPAISITYGVPATQVGIVFGVTMLIGGVIGNIAGGAAISNLTRRFSATGLLIALLLSGCVALLASPFLMAPNYRACIAILFVYVLFSPMTSIAFFRWLVMCTDARVHSTCVGIASVALYIMSMGVPPFTMTVAENILGGPHRQPHALTLICATCSALAILTIAFSLLKRTAPTTQSTACAASLIIGSSVDGYR